MLNIKINELIVTVASVDWSFFKDAAKELAVNAPLILLTIIVFICFSQFSKLSNKYNKEMFDKAIETQTKLTDDFMETVRNMIEILLNHGGLGNGQSDFRNKSEGGNDGN